MMWETIQLGEVIDVKHGYAFKGEYFSESGEFILLTPGNCHEGGGLRLKGDSEKYYAGDFPGEYLLNKGDLLVVMTDLVNTAPVLGGSFVIPEDNRYLHNQRLGLVHVTDPKRMDKGFLYHLLNTREYRGQVRGSASGATVRHTSPGRIRACALRIPTGIAIQRRIADILSAYDDLIENNRRRIRLLEDAARMIYREWFVRLCFPGYEKAQIVDGVPEGWEKTNAYDVMDILSGGTPKTSVAEFWNGDIPFYTPKDAPEYCYVLDTERHITETGLRRCNSRLYPKNTLFVSARGTVGKLKLAQRPMAMSQSCYALVGKGRVSQLFLYSAVLDGIHHLKQQAAGAVFDAIVVDTFKRIPFVLPSRQLIDQYEDTVQPMFNQVENLVLQNTKLQQARDILLPRLMSGEIEVLVDMLDMTAIEKESAPATQ